jgi:hypothetical protein
MAAIIAPESLHNQSQSCILAPVPQRDPDEEAARQVEKITGSEPARGEDLVSSETLKRKFRDAKKRLLPTKYSRQQKN